MAFGLFRWPACRRLVSWAQGSFWCWIVSVFTVKSHMRHPWVGQSRAVADLVGNGFKCSNEFFGFGVKSDHLSISSVRKIKWRARWGGKPIWGSILLYSPMVFLWQPLKKSTLYGENSTEEQVFWGLGGGTGAEMTSIGLGGWLPLWCRIACSLVHWPDRVDTWHGRREEEGSLLFFCGWDGSMGELRYFFSRAFSL